MTLLRGRSEAIHCTTKRMVKNPCATNPRMTQPSNLAGEAELAVQQKPELMQMAGTEIVGTLPGDLNMVTTFAAGVWVDSKNREAAKALVTFLHLRQAAAMFRAKGLDTP